MRDVEGNEYTAATASTAALILDCFMCCFAAAASTAVATSTRAVGLVSTFECDKYIATASFVLLGFVLFRYLSCCALRLVIVVQVLLGVLRVLMLLLLLVLCTIILMMLRVMRMLLLLLLLLLLPLWCSCRSCYY